MHARRGGYCFEQNTLFATALRALGFEVATLEARVRPLGAAAPLPRTHMVLRVAADGLPYLADVGYGGSGPIFPVLLDGTPSEQPGSVYAVRMEERDWLALHLEWSGGPAREFGPAFSPNGRWLAYVSSETGRGEVYVQRYPTGERQAVSTGGGTGPRWSSRGDEMFFGGFVDGTRTLFTVAVRERGDRLEIGEPEPLFAMVMPQPNGTTIAYEWPTNATTSYDVFPDGQRFVMSRGVQEPPRELVIVQNFFEEARRLALTR